MFRLVSKNIFCRTHIVICSLFSFFMYYYAIYIYIYKDFVCRAKFVPFLIVFWSSQLSQRKILNAAFYVWRALETTPQTDFCGTRRRRSTTAGCCEAEVFCRVVPTALPTEKAAFKVVSVMTLSLFHDADAGNAGRRGGLQGSGTPSASSSGNGGP